MIEMNSEEELFEVNTGFIYFYTPMCGTCKLAHEFLRITEHVDQCPEILKMDLNFANHAAVKWQIESVPCLVSIHNGQIQEKLYAFKSVPDVTTFISQMQNNRSEK